MPASTSSKATVKCCGFRPVGSRRNPEDRRTLTRTAAASRTLRVGPAVPARRRVRRGRRKPRGRSRRRSSDTERRQPARPPGPGRRLPPPRCRHRRGGHQAAAIAASPSSLRTLIGPSTPPKLTTPSDNDAGGCAPHTTCHQITRQSPCRRAEGSGRRHEADDGLVC